jgi:hypothetical protein
MNTYTHRQTVNWYALEAQHIFCVKLKPHTSEKKIQNSTEPHDVFMSSASATIRPSLPASWKVSHNSQGYSNSSPNRFFYKSAQ